MDITAAPLEYLFVHMKNRKNAQPERSIFAVSPKLFAT